MFWRMSRAAAACAIMVGGLGLGAARADCALPPGAEAEIRALASQINGFRASHGLAPLELAGPLMDSARSHACTMVRTGVFTHNGGGGAKARMKRAGCRTHYSAENIAMGFASGAKTMQLWVDSPGHRRILLMRGMRKMGLGVAAPVPGQGGGPRWVLDVAAGC